MKRFKILEKGKVIYKGGGGWKKEMRKKIYGGDYG